MFKNALCIIAGTANLGWLARASEGTSAVDLVTDYCGLSRERTGEPAIRISEKSKVHIPSYDAFPSKCQINNTTKVVMHVGEFWQTIWLRQAHCDIYNSNQWIKLDTWQLFSIGI